MHFFQYNGREHSLYTENDVDGKTILEVLEDASELKEIVPNLQDRLHLKRVIRELRASSSSYNFLYWCSCVFQLQFTSLVQLCFPATISLLVQLCFPAAIDFTSAAVFSSSNLLQLYSSYNLLH